MSRTSGINPDYDNLRLTLFIEDEAGDRMEVTLGRGSTDSEFYIGLSINGNEKSTTVGLS